VSDSLHFQPDSRRATLLNLGDAVIISDTEGRVTFLNLVAESLTGWTLDEATGSSLESVFKIVNQETRQTVESPTVRALLDGVIVGLATLTDLVAKDGTERHIDGSASPLRNEASNIIGAVLVVRDVTERHWVEQLEDELRKRTEQLAEAEARIRAVVNNVINGIITIDDQGVVESFNSAAARLFGYKDEEVIGQNVKILMGEPYHSEHDGYLANYKRTGQARIIGIGREVEGRRKDGSTFSMDLGVSEFQRGERRYFTAVVRDITERNRLADELRQVAADLSEADRRKNEFLATLAHELCNPLAPIRNGLELMKLAGGHATTIEQVRSMMERQLTQMVRLVDDLMDVSRITSSHHILVVDDNRDGADSLAMMLQIMGNETRTAYDGQEGLNMAGEFRPEVVLLDIGLPKLNGYEACRRIREQPWGKGVVMIAVTGWGQDDDRRRSHEAGFDHHMVKPVDPASPDEDARRVASGKEVTTHSHCQLLKSTLGGCPVALRSQLHVSGAS